MTEANRSKSLSLILDLFDADRPLIYIQSPEEDRVRSLLERLAAVRGKKDSALFSWSLTEGLRRESKACKEQPGDAVELLDFIIRHDGPGVFLLTDFHEPLRDSAEARRRLRDAYYACLGRNKFVVICSAVKYLPTEVEREVGFCKLPMPDMAELQQLVSGEVSPDRPENADAELVYAMARALQGLSLNESRHAIRFAATRAGRLDASAIPLLQEEKRLLVRRTGLMEFVPPSIDIEQIGGLDVMKRWLGQRRDLFYSRESVSAEIVPRGVLFTGVSGCGKSLSAQVVAAVFGLPLYRVEMSQIFSAGLGNAERLFAETCRTMEEIAPAVVWFDEIENSISRHHSDSSGVLDRIFGYFLTWMQEKPLGLFVAATANRIDLLPAELIRKGRFDQVFFIDLPDRQERLEIFRIHLHRRHVELAGLSLEPIVNRSEGWTGAEIEQCVISAITAARIDNKPVSDDYLFPAMAEIVPLSKTMKEQVAQIRSWAFDRAVRASSRH